MQNWEAKTGILAYLFWKKIKPSIHSSFWNIPDDLLREAQWQGGRLEYVFAPADKTRIISIPLHLALLVVLLLPLPASVWACQAKEEDRLLAVNLQEGVKNIFLGQKTSKHQDV